MASSFSDKDGGYRSLLDRFRNVARRRPELTVGVHAEEGELAEQGGMTVLDVGIVHEFGAPEANIPRRSFIADWFDETRDKHNGQIRRMARAVAAGRLDWDAALEQLGVLYVGEVQNRIRGGIQPELKPRTIARKGSSTPLIDTGQLRSSITYRVRGGG